MIGHQAWSEEVRVPAHVVLLLLQYSAPTATINEACHEKTVPVLVIVNCRPKTAGVVGLQGRSELVVEAVLRVEAKVMPIQGLETGTASTLDHLGYFLAFPQGENAHGVAGDETDGIASALGLLTPIQKLLTSAPRAFFRRVAVVVGEVRRGGVVHISPLLPVKYDLEPRPAFETGVHVRGPHVKPIHSVTGPKN